MSLTAEFLYPYNILQTSLLQGLSKLHIKIRVLLHTDALCNWLMFTPSLLAPGLSRRACALLFSRRSRVSPLVGLPGRILQSALAAGSKNKEVPRRAAAYMDKARTARI